VSYSQFSILVGIFTIKYFSQINERRDYAKKQEYRNDEFEKQDIQYTHRTTFTPATELVEYSLPRAAL
jgi:hypothetical protein